MPNAAGRSERIYEFFLRGKDVTVGERDHWLARQPLSGEERDELRRLLAGVGSVSHPTDATAALDAHVAKVAGAAPGVARTVSDFASGRDAGDQIGAFKLISPLGEGGFGEVWLAERREPFVQRVALKLIKPGMDSKAVIARFEQERQALALMNHPQIAKVLDGGLTPRGHPYFAMEYVKGEPITEFCDTHRLSVKERLELFCLACEAVQHAHLKGIVHRDVKPSNILAFEAEGGRPSLKVIDFGVAKAMSQTLTDKTIFTETGQMIGTPAYMSPEQADPTAGDIDTRSDIYSLGVLLYEVVAGATPFDSKTLRAKAYGEIQRIIREEDPPSPSARLSTISTKDAELASKIEKSRGVALRELARELRSELEWIPLKAMRKEPRYRYQTAIALAEDVRAYLDGKPIAAAPESTAYRARKYFRRNRAKVLGAGALFVGLSAGTAGIVRGEIVEARTAALAAEAETVEQRTAMLAAQRESLKSILEPYLTAEIDSARGDGRQSAMLAAQMRVAEAWLKFCRRQDPPEADSEGRAELSEDLALLGRAAIATARAAASRRVNLEGAGDGAARALWLGHADDAVVRLARLDAESEALAALRVARGRMEVDQLRTDGKRAEARAEAERLINAAEKGALGAKDPALRRLAERDTGLLRVTLADLLWLDATKAVQGGVERAEVMPELGRAVALYESETVRRRALLATAAPDELSAARVDLAGVLEKLAFAYCDPAMAPVRGEAEAAMLSARADALVAEFRATFLPTDDSSISLAERQEYATGLGRLADFPLSVAEARGAVAPAVAEAACESLDTVFDTHLRSFLADTSNLRTYDELLKLTQRYLGPSRGLDASWRRGLLARLERTVIAPLAEIDASATATTEVAAAQRALEMAVLSRMALVLSTSTKQGPDGAARAQAIAARSAGIAAAVGREIAEGSLSEGLPRSRAVALMAEAELAAATAAMLKVGGAVDTLKSLEQLGTAPVGIGLKEGRRPDPYFHVARDRDFASRQPPSVGSDAP